MTQRVLVTGGGGFVGQWLARTLLERGSDVWLSGLGDVPREPAILGEDEWGAVRWVAADIRDAAAVDRAIDAARPDVIVHLAGISFLPDADRFPEVARDVNVRGFERVAAAALRLRESGVVDPLVLVVGSGVQYGAHSADEMPLEESAELRPSTVYAETKTEQERAALRLARERGLRAICTRSFNHSGVGHGSTFLLPSLVARVKALPAQGGTLIIGEDTVRDYLHVDDVVRAYLGLVEGGEAGQVYNIASGVGIGAHALAAEVAARAGKTVSLAIDPVLRRRADIPILVGSPARLTRDVGWRPIKSHRDIIGDLFAAF